jgi:hypothetical protein
LLLLQEVKRGNGPWDRRIYSNMMPGLMLGVWMFHVKHPKEADTRVAARDVKGWT